MVNVVFEKMDIFSPFYITLCFYTMQQNSTFNFRFAVFKLLTQNTLHHMAEIVAMHTNSYDKHFKMRSQIVQKIVNCLSDVKYFSVYRCVASKIFSLVSSIPSDSSHFVKPSICNLYSTQHSLNALHIRNPQHFHICSSP